MNESEEKKPSQILISFEEASSTRFEVQIQNISPNQLLLIGAWLTRRASQMMDELDSANKISIPQPAGIILPPGLDES